MQGKERVPVLFRLFINWKMTKYVCMVFGMIQSRGKHHNEEERGGNGRNHLKDWDLSPSRGLAVGVLALWLEEEEKADSASVSY